MKISAYLCHRLQYGSVSARGGRTLKMANKSYSHLAVRTREALIGNV